ncbi:polyphenol oxidase, chloroplastic-like [Rutidosis leptorrhynchoides]|uniref:polyphenol oxidase, chloroplastic-like n=1 Tax=Rutidosis leptorrhynchoides TaxID=125765 RepID=UPI003A99B84E
MSSFSLLSSTIPSTKNTKISFSRSPKTLSHNRFKVSCNANTATDDDNKQKASQSLEINQQNNNVDRRNVLVGLGGLYGAANLSSIPSAFAVPIQAPDNISLCVNAHAGIGNMTDAVKGVACCPPVPASDPVTGDAIAPPLYQLPPRPTTLRTRPTAQAAANDPVYLAKFMKAVKLMKALPDDDPRSWNNQGKIHCAYCNAGYTQEKSGFDTVNMQVHNSWLFFPFHRWYLYFLERIMGSLLGDDTFALPYWNWDNTDAMTGFPTAYELSMPSDTGGRPSPKNNPLFDGFRDATHVTATVDLQGGFVGTDEAMKNNNLAVVHDQMSVVGIAPFFGGLLSAGPRPTTMPGGSIEAGVHTRIHIWTGNPRMPNNEDMGNFYSAGYDPLFYCHHANVDRMWYLWKTVLNGGNNIDPTTSECGVDNPDPGCQLAGDWENSSFVFYDENKNLVRVKSGDCVDIEVMGYTYADSDISPWLNYSSTPHAAGSNIAADSIGKVKKVDELKFPLSIAETVKFLVKRPAVNRSHKEKKGTREILMINGIEFDGSAGFKFDVLIDDVDDGTPINASDSEFAGTFEQLQHGVGGSMKMTTGAMFGITGLLEELKADGDEYILVTIVPNYGCEKVTIGDVKIELLKIRR